MQLEATFTHIASRKRWQQNAGRVAVASLQAELADLRAAWDAARRAMQWRTVSELGAAIEIAEDHLEILEGTLAILRARGARRWPSGTQCDYPRHESSE